MSTGQRIGPLDTFKVGQRVFYYAGGQAIGNKSGPFTVLAWFDGLTGRFNMK